jgi:8-oxo-dGTP pyrophosphatase MutT (NUDIX family)
MNRPEIECLASRIVYRNRWMTVRQDRIRRRSGATGLYGVVDKPDFAVIAAVRDGRLLLVEQYRYPVGARLWELPQGAWEDRPDADPALLAAGELREETGYAAASLVAAGSLFLACGYSSQRYHIYLATGLSRVGRQLDAEEEGLAVADFSLAEVEEMMRTGRIVDATTVAALGLLKLKGLLPL